jgi:GxxExxY protein
VVILKRQLLDFFLIFLYNKNTRIVSLAKPQSREGKITMKENEISAIVIDCCYKIHQKLGPGLLESVYEEIFAYELTIKGLAFEKQKVIPLKYGDIKFDIGFRSDFIVEKKVIIELKSVESILPVHKKQLLTYLKVTKLKLGLLINFNSALIKSGIIRVVNNL